MTSIQIKLS